MEDGNSKKEISKITYRDFLNFMRRYKKDQEKHEFKEKRTNPYKYKKVFNKDKK